MAEHTDFVYGQLGARADAGSAVVAVSHPRSFEIGGHGAWAVPAGAFEDARQEARTSGYAVGWAQGMREAAATTAASVEEARLAAQHAARQAVAGRDTALAAMSAAVHQLERACLPGVADLQDVILSAAVEIAQALLGRELQSPTAALDAARRVLDLVPSGAAVTVRLAPADHALLTVDGATQLLDGRSVTLVADPTLDRGDAIATTAATMVDGRLSLALDRVRTAVAP